MRSGVGGGVCDTSETVLNDLDLKFLGAWTFVYVYNPNATAVAVEYEILAPDGKPIVGSTRVDVERQAASFAYFLVAENSARDFTGQNDWRWCRKCEACFYGPQAPQSACPAGGPHDGSGSSDYVIDHR